jgi:succinoglycan biosynthesis transport protein ExoP
MDDESSGSIHYDGGKTPGEYLSVLRRRKGQILAVAALVAAIATAIAIGLPPVYRSTATILVQEQEIPPDLVRSTITSFADERIQVISQQVMTRAVLLGLVDKYGLYEKYRQRATNEEILERMRKDIKLTTVNADISDRSSGRRVNATIAFTLSYDAPQADRAQKVVTELASLYLNENVKVRQQSVAETTAFLSQEADRLTAQIQEIETNLAQFKRRNSGRLPDSSVVNMQLADRASAELSRVERELSTVRERKIALEAQLSATAPNIQVTTTAAGERSLPPMDRLGSLQAQYASASAVYGADHPDIRRMQREIAALSAETGAPGKEADSADKLKKLEAELAALRERYSEDHPDIQRIKRSIVALQAVTTKPAASPLATEKRSVPDSARRPDNPAYVALVAQVEGAKRELGQLEALGNDLRAQQRTYDARLLQIPEVEREYHDLTRDYDNAKTRYKEVKQKQMQAEVSQELEQGRKAERFSLGEPPNLPERTFSPNRTAIALGGLVAALGSGLGLAGLREAFDPSVKGPLELARIVNVPILTPIPYIETQQERLRKRRRNRMLGCLIALAAVVFLLGIHYFLKPLPVLLDSLARRIAF